MSKAVKANKVQCKQVANQTEAYTSAFRPMAGFFLLYSVAFLGLVFTLDGNDYNTLLERVFWAVIFVGLIVGIQRHWPAMRQLIITRRAK
jgi:uncharacterized membrane protein